MSDESFEVLEIEYETIVRISDHEVVFRIKGTTVTISRDTLIDYDLEGRLWVDRVDAVALELI